MHIQDNYLSPSTCATLGAAMIPIWRRATMKVKEELTRQKMPLLGICAAFSFLIMMFNIPLPGRVGYRGAKGDHRICSK